MPQHAWETGFAAQALITGPSNIAGTVGGLIYSLGGITPPGGSTDRAEVYAYDHAANTWTAKANMPAARSYQVSVVTGGKVYVIGGRGDGVNATATVYEYTPGTNAWATKTSAPRISGISPGAAGTVVGSVVYVVYDADGATQAYDTAADTWTAKAASGRAAVNQSVAATLGGYVYSIGGAGDHRRYDPAANTWVTKSSPGDTRFLYGAVGAESVNLVFISFQAANGTLFTMTYSPVSDAWVDHADIPTTRTNQDMGQAVALVNDFYVYVIGGVAGGPNERYQIGPDPSWYIGAVALART